MPWISPLLALPKPGHDGKAITEASKLRIVADSTVLNTAMTRGHRVTMSTKELAVEVGDSDLDSTMNLIESYIQAELADKSRPITVVSSHLDALRYKRITMGINYASEIFQQSLEEALAGLKGVRNLWDDSIVFGRKDDGSHDESLKNLME